MPGGPHSEDPGRDEISALLRAWTGGDQHALQELTPIVYGELRRLARYYMKGERPGHSLQTTALVHEAYTRLVDYKRMQWNDRAHFFAVSAQLMRRILVERARRHNLKRGGGVRHVSLEEAAALIGGGETSEPEADLVALDLALNALAIPTRGRLAAPFRITVWSRRSAMAEWAWSTRPRIRVSTVSSR
jgi:RNA polymerase sigma factor (TIGR02999 family)